MWHRKKPKPNANRERRKMIKVISDSNVEIRSDQLKHSVYVGGVRMELVTGVSVDYKNGELCEVTIKAYMPSSHIKCEAKK